MFLKTLNTRLHFTVLPIRIYVFLTSKLAPHDADCCGVSISTSSPIRSLTPCKSMSINHQQTFYKTIFEVTEQLYCKTGLMRGVGTAFRITIGFFITFDQIFAMQIFVFLCNSLLIYAFLYHFKHNFIRLS